MNNIFDEFKNSNIEFDRSINTNNELPYNSEHYHIQPNELSYHKTFNTKLSYLYDNLMYIYSRCFIPNFIVPTKFEGYVDAYDNTIYENVKNFTVFTRNNKNYLFLNALTSIRILEHDISNNQTLYKNEITLIDPISGELTFKKINNLATDEEFLYVSENDLNIVYKYNLSKYLSNENIYKNKLFLEKSVGGEGDRYDPIKFSHPKNISTYDEKILIEDYGNKTLKFFDKQLNFLSYNTLLSLYNELTSFSSIKFQNSENIIAITKKGFYNLNFRDNLIRSSNFINLSSFLLNDEDIIDINFSKYNEKIIYILTNKNFYKNWNYDEPRIIGKKSASSLELTEFKSFYTISHTASSDIVYLYGIDFDNPEHQILTYEDSLDLISSLNNFSFEIYSKDDIFVEKEEYNQTWVYGKSIKKLAKNYDLLKNNVSYKFVTEYDSNGVLNYLGRIYNTAVLDYPKLNYDNIFSIGLNENFQATVINREFDKIYDLGKLLIDNILSNYNTTLNLNPTGF